VPPQLGQLARNIYGVHTGPSTFLNPPEGETYLKAAPPDDPITTILRGVRSIFPGGERRAAAETALEVATLPWGLAKGAPKAARISGQAMNTLVQEAKAGSQEAVNRLSQEIQPFLGWIVRGYRSRAKGILKPEMGTPPEDLMQEANIAFLESIDKFNPEKGAQFATFLKRRVQNRLADKLSELDPRGFGVEGQVGTELRRLAAAESEISSLTGKSPGSQVVLEGQPQSWAQAVVSRWKGKTKPTPERVEELRQLQAQTVASLGETGAAREAKRLEDISTQARGLAGADKEKLAAVLENLPEKQRAAVKMRLGLGELEPMEFKEIANVTSQSSPQASRVFYERGLGKLQKEVEKLGLGPERPRAKPISGGSSSVVEPLPGETSYLPPDPLAVPGGATGVSTGATHPGATLLGYQELPASMGGGKMALYNLIADLRDPATGQVLHPAGSTVEEETIKKFRLPIVKPIGGGAGPGPSMKFSPAGRSKLEELSKEQSALGGSQEVIPEGFGLADLEPYQAYSLPSDIHGRLMGAPGQEAFQMKFTEAINNYIRQHGRLPSANERALLSELFMGMPQQ